jgi:hypothetical protein
MGREEGEEREGVEVGRDFGVKKKDDRNGEKE